MIRAKWSIPCPYGPVVARDLGLHSGGTGVFAEREIAWGETIVREAAMAFGYPRFFSWRVPYVLASNLDLRALERWVGIRLPQDSSVGAEFAVVNRLLEIFGSKAGPWLTGHLEHHAQLGVSRVACGAENIHGLVPPLIGDPAKDFLQMATEKAHTADGYSPSQCAEVLGVIHRNAWTFKGLLTDGEYGYGLFHWGSLFNNSCTPNAVALFEGNQIVVRGLRSIAKNEEITVAYNAIAPRHTMQGRMQKFQCACPRCAQDRAIQMTIAVGRQERYFEALALGATREAFWSIPEMARNVEVYYLLVESGIQELMTFAGTQYGRWDLAFLAFETFLRRVSVRGPCVPEPLHEIDPVSYANVLLGLVNAAWRCGVEVLKNFRLDWHRDLPVVLASVKSGCPSANLQLLQTLIEEVARDTPDMVAAARERDAELVSMNIPCTFERVVNSAAESVDARDAENILLKPLVAQAFAVAHLAFLRNAPDQDVAIAASFRQCVSVVQRFLGPSEGAAIDAIVADAMVSTDVRQMLDAYKRVESRTETAS
jgi:hypothetical protein